MAVNRGKQFESIIQESFEKIENVSVIRLHDQTTGFKGSANPCDFLVYHKPYLYAIECKTIHGNTFPLSNISDFQWKSLLRMSDIEGIFAGIIVWWVDKDVTKYISIKELEQIKQNGFKSISYDHFKFYPLPYPYSSFSVVDIPGKKKKVFFDYDMQVFLDEVKK